MRDRAELDVAAESAHERAFGLMHVLRRFRRPLLLGLVLVVIDAIAGLAGPYLVKTGVDSGVTHGTESVLFAATLAYLGIAIVDLFDQIGSTFVTGRTAERIMLSLRVRVWAQLQRLSLDFYEREMAGRDHDPDDDRHRPVRVAGGQRPAERAGRVRDLRRRRRRAGAHRLAARADHAERRRPARDRDRVVPHARGPVVRPVPRAHRGGQRRLPGEPVRRARVAGVQPRTAHDRALPRARRVLPALAGRGPAAGGDLLPVRPVPRRGRRRARARRRGRARPARRR